MDPISLAMLAALAGGAGGEAGRQAWSGLTGLVRRPFRRSDDSPAPATGTGEDELNALTAAPDDESRARALRDALNARADADPEFRAALEEWGRAAREIPLQQGAVHNVISGGTVHGPVIQGRDFGSVHLSFGAPQPPVPPQS